MNPRPDDAPQPTPARSGGLLGIPLMLLRVLLTVGLAAAALLLMMGALVAGTVIALALVLWSLLNGRRPAPGTFRATFKRTQSRARSYTAGARPAPEKPREVIDIEAREVPDAPPPPRTGG